MFFQIPHQQPILKNFLFCCSMASQNNGDDTLSESQEVLGPTTNLEVFHAENWKWLQENAQLWQQKKASVFVDNLSQYMKDKQKDKEEDPSTSPNTNACQPAKRNSFLHTWPPWNLQKKTDNYGPEIDQRICNVLQECWQSPYQKEEITYTLEAQIRPKMPLPSNHLRLTSTWPSLNDKLKRTCNTLTMQCAEHDKSLACLMDMLTMAEATCYDEGKLVLEELEFDFPNTNRLLA